MLENTGLRYIISGKRRRKGIYITGDRNITVEAKGQKRGNKSNKS